MRGSLVRCLLDEIFWTGFGARDDFPDYFFEEGDFISEKLSTLNFL